MVTTLQIGLLTVLTAAVSATLEYSEAVVNTLPYQNIVENGNGFLNSKLVNPGAKVRLKRIENHVDGVGVFIVDTKWKDNTSGTIANHCNGRPGIEVVLNKCKTSSPALCCVSPQDCVQDFCFKRLYIDIVHNRSGKPYMRVKAKFYHPNSKKRISVEMNPFKSPTKEADEDHASKNNVPHVDSPIPQEALKNSPLLSGIIGEYKNQHFIGDMAWMENGVPRAKFTESSTKGRIRKSKTDHYLAGPVIFNDDETYNMILDLLGYDSHVVTPVGHLPEDEYSSEESTDASSPEP